MWDKSIDLLAGLERKTQAPSIVCSQAQGAANAKVAILYAMDIRLPPLEDFCSASQETDAVTNLPRFLEIEIAGRDFHFALEILKGLAHFPSTCGHAL